MTEKDDLLGELSAAYQNERTYRAKREYELKLQLQEELAEVITVTNYLLAKGQAMGIGVTKMARDLGMARSTVYARLLDAPEVVIAPEITEKVEREDLGYKYTIVDVTPLMVEVEYRSFGPDKLTGTGRFEAVIGYDVEEPFLIWDGGNEDPLIVTALEDDTTWYAKHLIKWVEEHNA